jgi:long-subunit fatty acid transport protein
MKTILFLSLGLPIFLFCTHRVEAAATENIYSNSARFAGIGGAAASSVSDPNGLTLNPAGLAGSDGDRLIFNLSSNLVRFGAPLVTPNDRLLSKITYAPLGDLLASFPLSPRATLGVGVSVAGGLGTDYGNVHFGNYPIDPQIKVALGSIELVTGLGIRLGENWKVGAAYRMSRLGGEIHNAQVLPDQSLAVSDLTDLSGMNFTGFRVGIQYRPSNEQWGIGVALRNSVTWNFKGNASGATLTTGSATPITPLGDARTSITFPLRLSVGGDLRLNPELRAFLQYDFIQSSESQNQETTTGDTVIRTPLQWNNENAVHGGLRYSGFSNWQFGLGGSYESQVIPSSYPQIFTLAPGPEYGVGLSAERDFHERIRLTLALAYLFNSGYGTPAADSTALPGDYQTRVVTGALSLDWKL